MAGLTVADGAQSVVVVHTLADDPPLGEHRVWADGAHIEGAPRSQQVIGADVTVAAADGEVPVRQGERGVAQHILHVVDEIKPEGGIHKPDAVSFFSLNVHTR